MNPKNRDQRLRLGQLAAIALLAVAAIWIYFQPSDPADDGRTYIGTLREEFQKISPPPGVSAIGDLSVGAKREAALVERQYATQLPTEQVFENYQQQLLSNGWTYRGLFGGTSNRYEQYCKGEFGASVEARPTDGSFIYIVSMSWSEITVYECSAKKQNG